MMRVSALLTLTSALTLAACDGAKEEPTPAPVATQGAGKSAGEAGAEVRDVNEDDATATATASAKPSAKPKPSIEKKDRAALEKTRTTARGLLDEGRKLVKEKKYAEGIAAYRKVLAIDPRYGPALGELGWAYYLDGKLDDAHHFTSRALAKAEEPKRIGMLEYNLGRIAEDREQTEAAVGHYARSLSARPNATVQKRHDALVAGASTVPVVRSSGRGVSLLSAKPVASMEAACEILAKESMCEGAEECRFHAEAKGKRRGGVVELSDFIGECYHPVIEGPGGWWVFGIPLAGQLGSEIEQKVPELSASWVDDATLVFRFSDYAYERMSMWEMDELDAAGEEWELGEAESSGLVVCRVSEEDVGCTMAYREHFKGDVGISQGGSYDAKLTVDGDALVVSGVKATAEIREVEPDGEWDMGIFLPEGRYPLEDLVSRK